MKTSITTPEILFKLSIGLIILFLICPTYSQEKTLHENEDKNESFVEFEKKIFEKLEESLYQNLDDLEQDEIDFYENFPDEPRDSSEFERSNLWMESTGQPGTIFRGGNVGIGWTGYINSKLQVRGTTSITPLRVQVGGSSKLTVATNGGVTIGAFNNNPPENGLFVHGYVGIGTATPQHKLQLHNGAFMISSSFGNNFIFNTQYWNPDENQLRLTPVNNGVYEFSKSFRFFNNGAVGIGTKNIGDFMLAVGGNIRTDGLLHVEQSIKIATENSFGYKLAVGGAMIAEEVVIKLVDTWPDYVFHENYNLMSLNQIEQYIQDFGHLPDIPTAKEVEKYGVSIGEINTKLLKKIEELTLHMIELNKQNEEMKRIVNQLLLEK